MATVKNITGIPQDLGKASISGNPTSQQISSPKISQFISKSNGVKPELLTFENV